MRLLPQTMKGWVIALTLWALAVTLVPVCIRYERPIKLFAYRQVQWVGFRFGEEPVRRGLASGEFGPGTSVEALLAVHTPRRVVRHDNYVTVWYYPDPRVIESTQVIAKDGKLVFACKSGFCSQSGFLFFSTLSDDDLRAWDDSHENYRYEQRKLVHDTGGAVGGPAAAAFYNIPRSEIFPDPTPDEGP
jgi:hypothetical protein